MHKKHLLVLLLLLVVTSISTPFLGSTTYAEESQESEEKDKEENKDDQDEIDDIQEKIEEYEKKIQELQGKANSLSSEIEYMNSQIRVVELKIQNSINKISSTEKKIAELGSDIEDLKSRIVKLENSIDYQKKVLSLRMRERYKTKGDTPLMLVFGSSTLNSMIQKTEYLKVMEKHDNKMVEEMGQTKNNYDLQRKLFEDKKEEEEQLKVQLQQEKAVLDSNKATLEDKKEEKDKLLEVTQNDEAKYQELLEEAREQMASFTGFTSTAGGGVIDSNGFGKGKEGWYYSQRDERWAGRGIGNSKESILNVGCLVTSVAMVQKKYGSDMTPADVAKDSKRFFSNTAMMLIPWKGPSGKSYTPISVSQIDSELDKDKPVIVGLYAGPYGTHFIVLAEKSGNDYIMYDPWYGPDLKFSSKYNKGSIFQAVVFK